MVRRFIPEITIGEVNRLAEEWLNESIAPSITFCTSAILSSVRWSLTMVYGWNT